MSMFSYKLGLLIERYSKRYGICILIVGKLNTRLHNAKWDDANGLVEGDLQ